MQLLADIHHLTLVTGDLDRLLSFYERVFGARVTLEPRGGGAAPRVRRDRAAYGPARVPGARRRAPGHEPVFAHGRLDHFGLNAASEEAFFELRRRVLAEGAGDGEVTDMGSLLSFSFTDPDGGGHEVIWVKPDVPVAHGIRRAEWTTLDLD